MCLSAVETSIKLEAGHRVIHILFQHVVIMIYLEP